jgi:cation diffusion facilitator CzcD-associated flavoprotein CzcO
MTRSNGSQAQHDAVPRNVDILIVGSGLSGLCLAVRLRQSRQDSFLIIEKGADIGGTWRDNRYPGCACDIPSHLYSLSFAPRNDWSRLYPSQPELWDYLRDIADQYELRPKIRFNVEMQSAKWDEAEALWHVTTNAGVITARILVSAIGSLHVPAYPKIPGIEAFAGRAFHSADWPAGFDLSGKRVGVIGTGASAVQFIPEIASKVEKLYVFQRTPPWVMPKLDRPIGRWEKLLFQFLPGYRRAFRIRLYWYYELRALALNGNQRVLKKAEGISRNHLARQIGEPSLRARLTPNYRMGCKRILISNDYYPTLKRANVELVTENITGIFGNEIVTGRDHRRTVDVIIYGTGFDVSGSLKRLSVTGHNGIGLSTIWRTEMPSYYGICVSGFPNFFILLGPNTGLGHNSVVIMIEAQVNYIMRCLDFMRRMNLKTIDVKPGAQANFYRNIQERLQPTVWQSGGCRSWYQDEKGQNVAIWPGFTFDYRWQTRNVAWDDYSVTRN